MKKLLITCYMILAIENPMYAPPRVESDVNGPKNQIVKSPTDSNVDNAKHNEQSKKNYSDSSSSSSSRASDSTTQENNTAKLTQNVDAITSKFKNKNASIVNSDQYRTYDPNDLTKTKFNGPIMNKTSLSDGSTIRTYFDENNNPNLVKIDYADETAPRTIIYNTDGSVLYDSDPNRNKTSDTTVDLSNTSTQTNIFSSSSEPETNSFTVDNSTKSLNSAESSAKAPDDIRAKADQFAKLNNYIGDINTPIIDMYKKPGETVRKENSYLDENNIYNYEYTLSDGTVIHTKLTSDGKKGPKLISTDVQKISSQTNVKYNPDGSKTEIFTPSDGSDPRTVTYNTDGSVSIIGKDAAHNKKFTKEQAAAKKTGISGKLNWINKRSNDAYQAAKTTTQSLFS